MALAFRVLGPVEADRDGRPLPLGGRKQRSLLAMLALAPGEPVSADRLIEALWPEYDPGAGARLQVYVSQLRKALGSAGAVLLDRGGYALAVDPDGVDANRFERMAREGRQALDAGEAERASRLLRGALALWRGQPLGDLAYEPFAQAAVSRLEELRLGALEDRMAADLDLGRHAELVAELEQLVAEQPLRERPRGQLMLALHRCGRQAAALDVFRAGRRTFVDELGIEPSAQLRGIQERILREDPALLVEPAEVRARRHLPVPATGFVGRRAELLELLELLRAPEVRLLTLTGPGGTGKTRLALQAAADLAADFEHGVWFVDLAGLDDAELVPDSIAAALGVQERADQPVTDTLARHLRDRSMLLLLDNFEHVDAAAPVVGKLLEAAGGLKELVTSRRPLRLYGEHEYPVPALALPDPGDPDPAAALESEAVSLFAARAEAARRGFRLAGDDVAHVGELCARLDGLPLAIELAAARSRSLSPAEMVASLPRRLELAAEGPRDVPHRQQTLRATLDWSHRLLDSRERKLFARLAVFAGGLDEEAALQVSGAGPAELDGLSGHGLLARRGGRLLMLETVREYALERLAESGEEERLRDLHAVHYMTLAEATDEALPREPEGPLLDRLEEEHPNLRSALAWLHGSGPAEYELRLATALARFWAIRGHLREGSAWLLQALERGDGPVRAGALAGAASLALRQGDYEQLGALAGEGLALYRSLGDRRGEAQALDRLATAVSNQHDYSRGQALYEQSAAICRELGDTSGLAASITNLGCLAVMQGDLERAAVLSEEGLALHRQTGRRDATLHPLFNLGLTLLLQQRQADAEPLFREGLELARELRYPEGAVYFLEGLAAVHAERGEPEQAATLVGAAAAAGERAGMSLEPLEQELHHRTVATLAGALGSAALSAALAAGRQLSLDDVVARALEPSGA